MEDAPLTRKSSMFMRIVFNSSCVSGDCSFSQFITKVAWKLEVKQVEKVQIAT